MGEMPFNEEKFRELLLYVAERSIEDPRFGAIKLNKILYYSDFNAYRELGRPITGADYQRLDEGPAPRQLLPVKAKMIQEGIAEEPERRYFSYVQRVLVARRLPNLSIFSRDEIRIVDEVLAELMPMNGREVSRLSHEEIGWMTTEDRESIPYSSAWLSPEPLTAEQVELGRAVAQRHELER
jgi:hypothetical protein